MDYEKLGAFYLGRRYDGEADRLHDEPLLYDARDLTTHAVIIGMTGSGKTGLGVGLLEEAAMDRVPVIAVDPKGDLANLLLTFPDLAPADFQPWVNARAAADQGMTVAEYAAAQAKLWRRGLGEWGQDGGRIARLRGAAEFAVYTPGSGAGLPLSVLRSFAAPASQVLEDADLYRERVQATATGILALAGLDADPLTSREHVLVANILDHAWRAGRSLDLGGLIAAIQQPPMQRIGVMDVESFYPSSARFALAMRLNALLAAPGFAAWTEGEALDVGRLLHTVAGKPRVSVLSIAHLSDAERMFFVTMLLNELVAWMRTQPGTGSLRAVLYMDEVFGYLPPVANPPSKTLFLTLLKQARAYGVGLVLATQNPVDLDYKALSNAGTWFIGRLQTERDKARVMDGLEGVAAGAGFDRGRMEQVIAGLGKRRFLLHNVHEDAPVVFGTRWAMSYLCGPLTRDQIRRLSAAAAPPPDATAPSADPAAGGAADAGADDEEAQTPPPLPPSVEPYFVPALRSAPGDVTLVYLPRLAGAADVAYSSARYHIEEQRRLLVVAQIGSGPVPVDWSGAAELELDLEFLESGPPDAAAFAPLPGAGAVAANYDRWAKAFKTWIRTERVLRLYRSPALRLVSRPDETEGDFRVRLQELANEQRDLAVEKLRGRYASKVNTLQERLRRAGQVIERERQQASQKKLDAAISFGTAVLGAVLGRKVGSRSTSRMGTAMKSVGRIGKETGDVRRAEETALAIREQLAELDRQLAAEVEALESARDAQQEELTEIPVKASSSAIEVHFVTVLWLPHYRDEAGRVTPAWC